MKKKFELSTQKVKGISFHKTRHNWVGVGLFTGEVQIWDFRNGFMVAQFKDNDSCIRSTDFHAIQSLIVSGGDDFLIKGWDFSENKKVFELKGHVDFIRSVQFHNELPWVLSASDDQTLRIWNWQSKSQLTVITGHGHYVMSARFHPTKDLIVSGSLDSTIRIWDYAKLKSKFSSSHGTLYFLSNDVEPLIVTEGHVKGVNWVDFHPTEDLIVSCSDDRLIKLWKYTNSAANEDQVFHGHSSNVSCVAFTSDGKHVVSNGEDFQLRMWDLKGITVSKVTIPEQKQWVLSVHAKLPFVAVGCDKSFNIISIGPEKVQYDMKGHFLVYYSNKEKTVKFSDLQLNTTKKFGFFNELDSTRAKSLTVNPFKTSKNIIGFVALKNKDFDQITVFNISLANMKGQSNILKASMAVFISGERLVTAENKKLQIYQIQTLNLMTTIDFGDKIEGLYQGGLNKLFIRSKGVLAYFDIETEQVVFIIDDENIKSVKRIQWNRKRTHFVIETSAGLHLYDKRGKSKCYIKEESKVKSLIWHDNNKIVYNTHEHIKYVLLNGDIGIIRSIDKIIFLMAYHSDRIVFFDVNEEFESLDVDTTDIDFKLALQANDHEKIKAILAKTEFLGNSMVSFLLKKKHSQIALQLTKDKQTAFYLALHSGNLEQAYRYARELNDKAKYIQLAEEAARLGSPTLAEVCYNLGDAKDKLLTLNVIAGNIAGLRKLEFEDKSSRFMQSMYLGDVKMRIKLLAEAGQIALAYATAKTYGVREYVDALEKGAPEVVSKVKLPAEGSCLLPPKPLVGDFATSLKILDSWPVYDTPEEINRDVREEYSAEESEDSFQAEFVEIKPKHKPSLPKAEANQEEIQEAWGVGDDIDISEHEEEENQKEIAGEDDIECLNPFIKHILRKSLVAWHHFSLGDIERGVSLLETQIALKTTKNLDPILNEFKQTALYIDKNDPMSVKGLDDLPSKFTMSYFASAYKQILSYATKAKIIETIETAKTMIRELVLARAETDEDIVQIEQYKAKLLNYCLAFRAKLESDIEGDENRKTELCLIMCLSDLEPVHQALILQLVINTLYKLRNYVFAAYAVKKLLRVADEDANAVKGDIIQKMKKILATCEQKGTNASGFEFKESYLFDKDMHSKIEYSELRFMSKAELIACNYDLSHYKPERRGELSQFSEFCEIGYTGLGVKYFN